MSFFRRNVPKWDAALERFEDKRRKQLDPEGVIAGRPGIARPGEDSRPLLGGSQQQGRSVLLESTEQLVTILNLSGDDNESKIVAIQLINVSAQESEGVQLITPVRGLIEWGAAGVQAVSEFDFIRGTLLTVGGSFVRVSARLAESGSPVKVGALAALGAPFTGRGRLPQLSFRENAGTDIGSAAIFPVPPFAHEFQIMRNLREDPSDSEFKEAPVRVEVQRVPPNLYGFRLDWGVPMDAPAPLPNSSRAVRIRSEAAIGVPVTIVFHLAL